MQYYQAIIDTCYLLVRVSLQDETILWYFEIILLNIMSLMLSEQLTINEIKHVQLQMSEASIQII